MRGGGGGSRLVLRALHKSAQELTLRKKLRKLCASVRQTEEGAGQITQYRNSRTQQSRAPARVPPLVMFWAAASRAASCRRARWRAAAAAADTVTHAVH